MGPARGDKAGGGGDRARRRRRKWREYTDAGSDVRYYSEGMTTTWTRLEDVPVSFPSVGPNTSSPTTSRRRLVS